MSEQSKAITLCKGGRVSHKNVCGANEEIIIIDTLRRESHLKDT
jgi:hypothetical protein